MITQTLESAMKWLSMGQSPIPMYPKSKLPAIYWNKYIEENPEKRTVERWFRNGVMNVGLVCGGANNITVLDFDSMNKFAKFKTNISTRTDCLKDMLDTYCVKTSRGIHVYLKSSKKEMTRKTDLVDIRGERSLVVIPPSTHPSGVKYKEINKSSSDILVISTIGDIFPEPKFQQRTKYERDIVDDLDELCVSCNSKDIISIIKERISMYAFASSFTELHRSGGDGKYYIGKCIVHKDSNPSFWINTHTNRCGCFSSSCQLNDEVKNFDVIDLYKMIFHCTTRESIVSLSRYV